MRMKYDMLKHVLFKTKLCKKSNLKYVKMLTGIDFYIKDLHIRNNKQKYNFIFMSND